FFQADDGIRDFHVTGVQTCALPISHGSMSMASWAGPRMCTIDGERVRATDHAERETGCGSDMNQEARRAQAYAARPDETPPERRSVERRVGKAPAIAGGPGSAVEDK